MVQASAVYWTLGTIGSPATALTARTPFVTVNVCVIPLRADVSFTNAVPVSWPPPEFRRSRLIVLGR